MSDQDEWGPWAAHHGGGCPCAGQWAQWQYHKDLPDWMPRVDVKGRRRLSASVVEGIATGGSCWLWRPGYVRIIRYRVRKPRAMKLIQSLLENLPERIDA